MSQVNVSSNKIRIDTLSVLKSVYFFIANTSKVESSKMTSMNFKTFIIKVLVFIFIYLVPYKCNINSYELIITLFFIIM